MTEIIMGKLTYGSRWRKLRARFLAANPLCVYCWRDGIVEEATIVDHIKPHRGDYALFWDQGNWQGLCKAHHDSTKQREEKGGVVLGCDASGEPTGGWS